MRLPAPQVPPLVPAPSRAVQFVVELVGPKSVPTARAADLLRPDWRGALGQPELWTMRPSDTAWRPMHALMHGSYDSIALAWDLITPAGNVSPVSAAHLVQVAERFAIGIGRRAISLTAPDDVGPTIRRIQAAQASLDAGVAILLIAPRPVTSAEFGRELESLGLAPLSGEWGWTSPDHREPLFTATPFEEPVSDGLTLGFRLARCPHPLLALDGLFAVVDALAQTGLAAFDDDRRPLMPATRENLRQGARAGSEALASAGLAPGSWAALKVFN